jgi:hypothetical protein
MVEGKNKTCSKNEATVTRDYRRQVSNSREAATEFHFNCHYQSDNSAVEPCLLPP